MKIAESLSVDGTKLVQRTTHDWNPVLDQARMLRDAGKGVQGESRLVARVPRKLVHEWAKAAGLTMDDPALSDVIAKNLMSGDYDQFRVWGGTY